jgi:hypothetical protein
MTDEQKKKPGVAFWATVMAVAILAYVLSIGPFDWLVRHHALPFWALWAADIVYYPIGAIMKLFPNSPIQWYLRLWGWGG